MNLLRRHLLMLPAAVAVNSQTSDARTTTRGGTAAIYVDVTNPTGGTINPELYGASMHTGWGQGYDSFNLSSWCAATKSLNLRYLRLMGTHAMSTLFPAGATTIS